MNPAAVQKVQENAGTGPYENALQSGLTYDSPGGETLAGQWIHAAYHLWGIKQNLAEPLTEQEIANLSGLQAALTKSLGVVYGAHTPAGTVGQVDDIKATLGTLIKHARVHSATTRDIQSVQAAADKLLITIGTDSTRNDSPNISVFGFKSGIYFETGSSLQFDTLNASFGHRVQGALSSAFFLTASGLFPLKSPGSISTGRLGTGIAYGDPNSFVTTVSAASYLSPSAFDGSIGLSVRYPSPIPRGTTIEAANSFEATKHRTLLDHVRPGDVWFSLTARQISGSASEFLRNGQIAEAEVTIAPNSHYTRYYRPTTLTFSGLYSPEHELGIDELGLELRTPLNNLLSDRPVYFSARYGTRGHATLALDFRL